MGGTQTEVHPVVVLRRDQAAADGESSAVVHILYRIGLLLTHFPSCSKKQAYEINILCVCVSVCPDYQLLNQLVHFVKFSREIMSLKVTWTSQFYSRSCNRAKLAPF
jgi:hypothetical protein